MNRKAKRTLVLTQERENRCWSKSELARRAGLHSSTLSQIELQHQIPSCNQLAKLATALGIPVESAPTLMFFVDAQQTQGGLQ